MASRPWYSARAVSNLSVTTSHRSIRSLKPFSRAAVAVPSMRRLVREKDVVEREAEEETKTHPMSES